MAVNYIDPAAGALGEAFSRFGTAVGDRLTEKPRRERQLRENPQQMQALAQAYRQAVQAGQGNSFLEGIGVRPEFGGQILAFQPDVKERTETAMLTQGTPEALVRADTGEANVRGDTAEGIIQRKIIGMQLDNEVQNQILSGRGINAQLMQNLPEKRAYTERETLGAAGEEARFTGNLFRRRRAAGVDRLTVDSEVLGEQARQAGFRLEQSTLDSYKNYLDNLDPSSHEYAVALAGLRNPAQLGHIQFHEGMNFEMSMAVAKARGTPEDALATTIKVQDQYSRALDGYRSMLASDIPDDAKRQLMVEYQSNLNAWRQIAEDMQEDGTILPIDASLAAIEDEDRINFYERRFESQDVKDIFGLLAEEYASKSLANGDPLQRLKADSAFWGAISQRDREQLEKSWGDLLVETRAAQEAEGRALEQKREVERARNQRGNPTDIRAIYQGTSPGAKLDQLVNWFNTKNREMTQRMYLERGDTVPTRWQNPR